MSTTAKLQTNANALLDLFIGYQRAQGKRVKKEDAIAEFIEKGVRAALPPEVLTVLGKSKPSKTAKRA